MRAGELLDHAFHRLAEQIPVRDRAWTQELIYGVVRLRGRLDYLLTQFLKRPFDSLEPDVVDILRLGAYQLLEMGSVPAYAAVSQSVEMTRAVAGRGATGLVNGVLQSLRRAQDQVQPPSASELELLSTWGSHPRWLVERWLRNFGVDDTRALISANNQRPELYVRPVGPTPAEAAEQLRHVGIEAELVDGAPDALRIPSSEVARAIAGARVVVQDPAATLVVRYAAFQPGLIADLCAAPGGKALAISSAHATDADFVVAGDISFGRLLRLRESAQRVDARATAFVVADARRPPLQQVAQVLIDAPCTGTGTLRRHPDGKWRLTAADLSALVELQREILDGVAPLVSPGGLLVYATCSLEPEENEHQVNGFMQRHPEFRLEPAAAVEARFTEAGQLRVLPQKHGFDGAYAARLRKSA